MADQTFEFSCHKVTLPLLYNEAKNRRKSKIAKIYTFFLFLNLYNLLKVA